MEIKIKVKEADKLGVVKFDHDKKYATVEMSGDKEIIEDIKLLIEDASVNDYNWDII